VAPRLADDSERLIDVWAFADIVGGALAQQLRGLLRICDDYSRVLGQL
jgi:hypothetical protein